MVRVFRYASMFAALQACVALQAGAGQQAPSAATPPGASYTDPALKEQLRLPQPRDPKLPTLWLVGDSTVRNGHGDGAGGQWGWGELIVQFFDPSKINVVNRAIGGRSSRTYITEGHWNDTLAMMKAGDFMLVQMGHNDGGPLDDTSRARGSLHGIGEDTKDIENPILKRHETVHTYGWYMRQYVEQARAKGVIVEVCSLIPRKIWKDGHIVRDTAAYAGWAHSVAEQERTGFVDLNEIIAREYDAMGEQAVEPLFADPHTHTSEAGALINAKAVVLGLKLLHPDPFEKYFSETGKQLPGSMPPPVTAH